MISLFLFAAAVIFSPQATISCQSTATSSSIATVADSLARPPSKSRVATGPIKRALREGNYPWYDSEADKLRPVWPTKIGWLDWIMKRIEAFARAIRKFLSRLNWGGPRGISMSGDWIATVILLTRVALFLTSVFWLWRRRMSGTADGESAQATLGTANRLSDLPIGNWLSDGDAWVEAQRRRAAGDLAGAVICLFAHQLQSLEQLGLIRLVPGRTGRQYLQVVRNQELANSLGATLRLFEEVYYGRKRPTTQAFESVWNRALLFRERGRLLGAGAPTMNSLGTTRLMGCLGGFCARPGAWWMLAGPGRLLWNEPRDELERDVRVRRDASE